LAIADNPIDDRREDAQARTCRGSPPDRITTQALTVNWGSLYRCPSVALGSPRGVEEMNSTMLSTVRD
jgi:hypothetical protein